MRDRVQHAFEKRRLDAIAVRIENPADPAHELAPHRGGDRETLGRGKRLSNVRFVRIARRSKMMM
jgi:hypothetical protein